MTKSLPTFSCFLILLAYAFKILVREGQQRGGEIQGHSHEKAPEALSSEPIKLLTGTMAVNHVTLAKTWGLLDDTRVLISKILMPVLSTSPDVPCSLAASKTSNVACLFREASQGTRGQMAEALNPTACNALFSLFIERRGTPRTK